WASESAAPGGDVPWYVSGAADLVPRFWREVRELIAPHGEVVGHSWQWDDYPACLDLPGQVIALRYTPRGYHPPFGVTVWRPGGPAGQRLIHKELTAGQPHVTRADIEAAAQ